MRPALPRPTITTAPASESALDFGRHAGIVGGFERGKSCLPSFTRIDSLLPQINVTKHSLKRIEAVNLVREQRDERRQELAFHARPFVLPLRTPPPPSSF
jgi:hypothetical protein